MSIEAMQQALEALTHKKWFRIGLGEPNDPKVEAAITALSAAIEAAEKQEPAAAELRQQHAEIERLKKFCDDLICELSGLRWAASMQKRIDELKEKNT